MASQAAKQHSKLFPKPLSRDHRKKIEIAAQAWLDMGHSLIDFLQKHYADPDLEDDGSLEPSLGGSGGLTLCDVELDEADAEPEEGA